MLRLRRFELPWLKLDTTTPLSVELPEFETFSLCTRDGRKKYKATKLDVHPATRFVLRDDKRALSGFRFGLNDYIATPEGEYTWVDAELSLGLLVSDLQIEGISIVRTSALPWTAPPRRERSNIRNIRAPRGRAFMLRPSDRYYQPYSRYWEPVRRDAEAGDVYVTLDSFRCGDFYAKYRDDAAICAALKLGSIPVVYGYKCGSRARRMCPERRILCQGAGL